MKYSLFAWKFTNKICIIWLCKILLDILFEGLGLKGRLIGHKNEKRKAIMAISFLIFYFLKSDLREKFINAINLIVLSFSFELKQLFRKIISIA